MDPPATKKYANDGLLEGFVNFLDCLSQCEFSRDKLKELMSYTAFSLANLLLLKGDMIRGEKVKIESLKEKLDLFKDVFQFTSKWCNSHEEMENFKIHIQAWAFNAACLCLLNWLLDEKKENMGPQMNIVLLDLQQKIITSTPEVTRMCIAVLMALKPSAEVGSEVGQLVSKLVEFLLGNFQVDLPKDGIQMLFSVLIFLTTFLKDPPEAKKYANDGLQEGFLNFLDCLSQCEFSRDELQELMSYTAISLANLLLLKGDMIDDEKLKIESLKKKLDLFKDVFQFTSKWCNSHEEMENFKIHIQAWAFNAACLCLLNWLLDEKKENQAPKLNIILSELQQKIITSTPEVTRMCLAVLKVSKPSAKDGFEVGELVSKFVHFLLRNLQVDLPKDGIQMLCSGLIFLITFLMDPPEPQKYSDYKGTFFNGSAFSAFAYQRQAAAAAVSEAASLFSSLNATEIKESISEGRNSLLHDFLTKVNGIKAEVRKLHSYLSLDGSSFNWPRINVIGLLDSLIENLEEKSINFSKHQIVTVQEELVSLRNLLKASNLKECFMSDLQNKNKYLKDLWAEIINVVYQAEMTISSFMLMKNSVWLDMLCLFDITEEIKHIEGKVKRFQDQHMHEIDALNTELSSSPVVSMDEVVVGFKNEEKDILDHLTSGTKELEIILIIGMAGMGKTTLAKKVYGNPSIQYHFTKCAWCVVSQSYNSKKLLLDILTTVTGVSDSFIEMEEEELAQMLQRSLKGQRYLIVMDDIWDVSAWNALELSFPDDNNGSRIMFTSQIHNVALEAKPNSFPYHLSPLSEEESWELLEKRLFQGDTCPPNFVEVGRCIAKNCKGLPLAVVLVAGLLKKEIENLDWWKQIGENLVSWISREGCDEILKLSYKHLSEPLKSCFLYFGSFPEDKVIRVQRLTQLWVSEGFIPKQEMKTSEIVAKEYLMDLVNRSLVIVTDRSSMGEIKACRIHDLLWKFCLRKGEEENFLKVVHGNDVSQFSKDKHYRVLIQTKHWESFLNSSPPTLHSLLFSPTGTSAASTESFYFSKFKFLRVLNLEGLKFLGDFPEEVTTLVLLRYFSIWWNTSNTTIPRSITRLANLETLRIRRTGFATEFALHLPLDILSMKNLKHVHVGNCITPLNGNVPPLESIQSFSCAHLPAGKAESILRQIPKVRKLKCTFIESGTGIPKLDFLNHLESLKVTYGSCSFPQSLKKLTLRCFLKPWTEISIIANLPNLEVLKLRRNAFIGKTWNMEDEKFSKLKFLKLESAYIEEWNASPESFPCLECLIVEHCFELEEIPSEFAEIPTLGMIQVRWCKPTVARSAKQIREEQIELGNEDFKVLIY